MSRTAPVGCLLCSAVFAIQLNACSSDDSAGTSAAGAAGPAGTGAATASGTGGMTATVGSGGQGGAGGDAGGGGAAPACALGGSWELVDEFSYAAGVDTQARGLGTDGLGNVFVVGGTTATTAVQRWLVRKSADGGKTWTTIDDFTLPDAAAGALATGMHAGPGGDLYTVGSGGVAGAVGRIVRKSTDGGASWATVDTFQYASGHDTYAAQIDVDSTGTVYATGQAGSAEGSRWIVRKSADGGASWSTALDYQYTPGKLSLPLGLAIDATDLVYVSGTALDAQSMSHWLVRRGEVDGTWTTVDDIGGGPQGTQGASGLFAGKDRLFAAGYLAVGGVAHWTVRASEAGTWTTLDDYADAGGANAVYEDGAGALTVTGGKNAQTDPKNRVVTRRSSDGGKTWQTIDEYGYGTTGLYAGGLAADAKGNLYSAHIGIGADGKTHWLVRKMSCQ